MKDVARHAAVVALALLTGATALANTWPLFAGRPSGAGSEVRGLDQTAILEEQLTIDLREVGVESRAEDAIRANKNWLDTGSAMVEASYLIEHSGAAIKPQLMFVAADLQAGDSSTSLHVLFDGQPVTAIDKIAADVPWISRPSAPGLLDPDKPMALHGPLETYREMGYRFSVEIAPGRHRLVVRYQSVVRVISYPGDPVPYRQFQYALAPARYWKSFGKLKLEILYRPDWVLATNLPLVSEPGRSSGEFDGLPADDVALLVAPQNNYRLVYYTGLVANWLPLLLLIALLLGDSKALKFIAPLIAILLRLVLGGMAAQLASHPEHVSDAFSMDFSHPMSIIARVFIWGVIAIAVLVAVALVRLGLKSSRRLRSAFFERRSNLDRMA